MVVVPFTLCLLTFFSVCSAHHYDDTFTEELIIKPLATGEVYAQFKFTIEKTVHPTDQDTFKHFRLFPRSLGEIISKNAVQELHFSLTQGLWRYEKWGYPYRDAPPGAEIWAWFQMDTKDVNANWRNLVNILSGQFCASLNFIDETNTVEPKLSLRPQGAVAFDKQYNSSLVRYATLPSEILCTENLTPFKKLLPCDTKAGLSTLLNAVNLFNAHFVSLAIDSRRICKDQHCFITAVEFIQSVSVVFDPPIHQQGKQDWSFVKLFGAGLINTCPVAAKSMLYVDVSLNKTGVPFVLKPQPYEENVIIGNSEFAVYDLAVFCHKWRTFNINAVYSTPHVYWFIPPPVVYANRHITGYGQERGGIQCILHNNHPTKSLKILYMDVIPWFLRVYLHTFSLKSGANNLSPDYVHYKPGKDRERPHHLEVMFTVPPQSKTEISLEFEYVFLKWTEYPPDANHGFYVGPAIISTVVDMDKNFTTFPRQATTEWRPIAEGKHFLRIHTQVLLVSLPTPDFSMPYNVICLSCTVVALAFGPIHNITTKSLQPVLEEEDGLLTKLKKMYQAWRNNRLKKKELAKEENKKEQ